ncbi:universal stress protein [uncultured Mycobacterium sp.]|uniref:universal stress protein n=1 Tax=uncultured Mycobacterium sp. TaxID=171292 RepID=UPI0035CAC56F
MNNQERHFGVVVGIDGSTGSDAAVQWAAREAAMRKLRLTVVRAMPAPTLPWPTVPALDEFCRRQEADARSIINDAVKLAEGRRVGGRPAEIDSQFFFSGPVPTLVDMSKDADMVVVGARGLGTLQRLLLGSVSTGLVHHARCPVAVIHSAASPTPRAVHAPVLLGVDGSPASELATAIAFEEASLRGVGLLAIHAWSDAEIAHVSGIEWSGLQTQAEEILAERLAGWQERYPDVTVHRAVVYARPAAHLLDRSEQAQLVVVGSHGRGGFAGMLLGSVSTAVAQAAQVPVIVARGH